MENGRSSPVNLSNLSRSSSLRTTQNCSRTSLVRRNQSVSAKQVRFYRNGDRYYTGLKLAVSADRYKELESLLAELSVKLNLPTGAVRFIFNANDSSMITDITQLQYGVPYVCSSTNTYRPIEGGYGKHLHSWSAIAKSKNQYNKVLLTGVHSENLSISLRSDHSRDFIKPKLVTVIRNGKPPQKKVTLLLNTKTAISLDQVLDQLSAKGSLGKVDKLYAVDGRSVKTLRDLFDDDTVFIALSTNEKFPDDGIELDPNSYRITPYRELKRPSNTTVRRSNSLRGSGRHYKDEDENMSMSKVAKNAKNLNSKVARPRGSVLKNVDQNKEELYPTAVFESDSDSARAKRGKKSRSKPFQAMDIYNTVWLSDFESVHSSGTRSGFSSLNQSRASFPDNNMGHSTPRSFIYASTRHPDSPVNYRTVKNHIHRTLSLPENDLANINGDDLQERFAQLQVEQENRELRLLVRQLQEALEKLEKAMVNNFTSKVESACLNCTVCGNTNNIELMKNGSCDINSPDSLEGRVIKGGGESHLRQLKDRNESGYSTLNNESMLDDHDRHNLKEYQYMEYSDNISCSSDEERQYFASRLAKKRGHYHDGGNDSSCCTMQ